MDTKVATHHFFLKGIMTDQTPRMQFRSIGDDDIVEDEGVPTRLPSADDDDEASGIIPDNLELDEDLEDDGLSSEG